MQDQMKSTTLSEEYHHNGKSSCNDRGVYRACDYRTYKETLAASGGNPSGLGRPGSPMKVVTIDSPSDEFINDIIPVDLDTAVTWREVLACGMIPEQRGNRFIREELQYDNIDCRKLFKEIESIEKRGTVSVVKKGDYLSITYNDTPNKDIFTCKLYASDVLWKTTYSWIFQNDFNRFCSVLIKTFTENNFHVKWDVKDKSTDNKVIRVFSEDVVFGFNIDIVLLSEEKTIDKLEKRVAELEIMIQKLMDLGVPLDARINGSQLI